MALFCNEYTKASVIAMYRRARLFVHCCALLIALALIVSGCGGGAPSAGSGNGAATSPGTGSSGAADDSGQTGQGDQGSAPQQGAGDDDAELFDLSEWGLLGMYEIVSRFQTIGFEMTSPDDDLDWANIHITFDGTGDHDGGKVDRYRFKITGPNDFEDVDEHLEMWFGQDGTLVAVRDLNEPDAVVVTEPFVLTLTELHGGWMLLPFHSGRLVLGEADSAEDVVITSRNVSTEMVLGNLVTVVTLAGTAPDEDGVVRPFSMRIAQIGGLPFALEMDAGPDSMTITPTAIELR